MKLMDIFKSSTGSWDMGRILSFKTLTAFSGAFLYSVFKLHQNINWSEAGVGYAAVMAGCVAFIGGKEVAIAKATALTSGT